MSDADEEPTPSDNLSESLVQRVDTLGISELNALLSYIERRIEALRTPIEADIEANAAGEILKIENHRGYALVRKHPPDPNGPGVKTDITSLYHVRREQHLDGTEPLHWTYLGDVHTTAEIRCENCGRTFDHEVNVCPNCGGNDVENPMTEE